MQWLSWICRALCASTLACKKALVERVEVPTYHAQYVETTDTPTVTITVGIIATPVVYASPTVSTAPAATDAQARPKPGPQNFTDPFFIGREPTKHNFDFDAPSLLAAFGQWASEPIQITPLQIFNFFVALGLVSSFPVFMSSRINRYNVENVIKSLSQAFWAGSNVLWGFIFYLIHNLAGDANRDDPLGFFAGQLVVLYAKYPCGVLELSQCIPRWWAKYRRPRVKIWTAICAELEPPLAETGMILLRAAGRIARKLPGFTEWLLDTIATVFAYSFSFLCCATSLLSWILKYLVLAPGKLLTSLLSKLATKLWPAQLIFNIQLRFTNKGQFADSSHLSTAANMSLLARIRLLEDNARLRRHLEDFNANYTVPLGTRCIAYRATILASIKEINYLRSVLDAVSNHMLVEQHTRNPLYKQTKGPIRSARLQFTPNPTPLGLHYDIDEHSDRYNIDACYATRAKPALLRGPAFKPYAHNSSVVNRGQGYVPELFQKDAWGLEALDMFRGIELPEYTPREDPLDMRRWVQKEREAVLFEDIAASGEGLKKFSERWEY